MAVENRLEAMARRWLGLDIYLVGLADEHLERAARRSDKSRTSDLLPLTIP